MNQQTKAKAIAKKIKNQFMSSPEGMLMFSIVECALLDLSVNITPKFKDELTLKEKSQINGRRSAARYLSGNMPHCELAGVDSEWVHRLMSKIGLNLNY